MYRPPHPPRLYNSNHTWRWEQIMKLLIMQFSPPSHHSIPFSPNILLSTLFSNTLSICSSLTVRDRVSHPYRTTGKIIVLYKVECTFHNSLKVILTVWLHVFSEHVVADPTAIEERVSETQIVFAVNAYRELCGLHLAGSSLASHDLIVNCASRAARRAAEVVQIMKSALKEDTDSRHGEFHSIF
jgi:hypothetical protein